ncbi:SDR family NAD(P)-dependent oxidoreductase [Roseiterribacter gracilis]|uniref:Oxidoreductase n=1 Tax=Roseiterribacter gracilis TaxID=2812848 RepID=A0A8S8XF32_9PROT|nr:oxidoreductase [Rhodospirillales bacterium TMPK1]
MAERHAIVTGATRGIGWAIARRLADDGMRVTLLGRDISKLIARASEIGADFQAVDLTDGDAVAAAFNEIGPAAILINNAGIAESAPFLKSEDALFQRMFEVNVLGAVRCTRAVLPMMVKLGWGRVINIASTAGLQGFSYVSAYAASKHALVGITRSLALEVASRGVTVNAICPGYVATEMTETTIERIVAKTGRTRDEAIAELAAANPGGRLIQPEEVAASVAALCGDDAASITGQAIEVGQA